MREGLKFIGKDIYLNGEKIKIFSGAMHYFRIMPEYWKDRLLKLKNLGLNTVETYMNWGLHQPYENEWDFSGRLDLVKYINLAKELGLNVILRPGPYICSECEFGGLPWWLLKYPMVVRTSDERYLKYAKIYIDKVSELIKPLLYENGGNIIAVQLENEYGAYANDKKYLETLREYYLSNGIKTTLFTSDGITEYMMKNGAIDDVWMTINFRGDVPEMKGLIDKLRPNTPFMVMEYWNGRQMMYNGDSFPRDPELVASRLKEIIDLDGNFNLYMFHGGTNFGFQTGSNYDLGAYVVNFTSYDVDAPLNEAGNPTEKYYAEQRVIYNALNKPIPERLKEIEFASYGKAKLVGYAPLFNGEQETYRSLTPDSMENFNQGHGLISYKTVIDGAGTGKLCLSPHDRARIFVNGKHVATVDREDGERASVEITANGKTELEIIVEEYGRIKFADNIADHKGLVNNITFCSKNLLNWEITCQKLENIEEFIFEKENEYLDKPVAIKYEIEIDKVQDTFIKPIGFSRGNVWINGFNIGRHFDCGNQKTLYVPAPLLKKGLNEIIVTDNSNDNKEKEVIFQSTHELYGKGKFRHIVD